MKTKKIKISQKFLELLPWIWMLLIFYASSRQKVAISDSYLVSFVFFKSLHIIEYGILVVLWSLSLQDNQNRKTFSILFPSLYGAIDEFHQTMVPTRGGKLRDVFIDILGILIFSYLLMPKIDKMFNKRFKIIRRKK